MGTKNGDGLAKSLISALANADPDAVNHVKDLVQALIDAGEAERNVATQSRDDAQAAFDSASGNLDTATNEHTTVAGELSNAQDEVARLTALKAEHLTAQNDAQSAFDAASAALDEAETWLSDETVRIDGERATLIEIRGLLSGLLPSSGFVRDLLANWDRCCQSNFNGCQSEINVDVATCSSGRASLLDVKGDGSEASYVDSSGCQYWYFAEYHCS